MSVGSVTMPYDEIYYQRMKEDKPDVVREISIAIKRAIDGHTSKGFTNKKRENNA